MGESATFLLVDDDKLIRTSFARALRRYGEATCAASATEAVALIGSVPFDGFVIDVNLPDGSGLEVLARVRELRGDTPAVVFSGSLDRRVINHASTLGARFVCKPCGEEELVPFLFDVRRLRAMDRTGAATERARERWALSPRETEILGVALRGESRDEYVRKSGITLNTFKTHVRRLLEKSDYRNLASLSVDLLRE
jgi:DNA-binding NarL/FixJ family response regulator